ncbi:Oxoglutarate and iron-dependent oxygenase degradation C-term-domain-containing protein [Myxozyma melibiosi]|uniref:Oxoglutarate and iron-dependent oxygenase degradation C-term-domain-containing protein n=1 Tax=Myxozyma melibiosi TaxID=54550 RepID=A0ABR1FF77_9ASCO
MAAAAVNSRKRLRSPSPTASVASTTASVRSTASLKLPPTAIFAPGLFARGAELRDQHSTSSPYKHCVIDELVSDTLLRRVRREITSELHFTPKETDIYKLQQTGDLLNISGLPPKERRKLSALRALRDSMYSPEFRKLVEQICDCGPLSGKKQDMSINCYVKGSHLLTHDDVIGSRRVSYILYLPDPEDPSCTVRDKRGRNTGWDPKWGGALRLFEVEAKGAPKVDPTLSLPPAWNQLSFFVVQPGVSFHDVEEVYVDKPRLAISGWFHLPQEGEDGYIKGLQESLNLESSRAALADAAANAASGLGELPSPTLKRVAGDDDSAESKLTEKEVAYLARYISAKYLDESEIAKLCDEFADSSLLELEEFLNDDFAGALKGYIVDSESRPVPQTVSEVAETEPEWSVSRPPHKHRYLYIDATSPSDSQTVSPPHELAQLFSTPTFRKWLTIVSGIASPTHSRVLARRFRPGLDYTLATTSLNPVDEQGADDKSGLLEGVLCVTPTDGWDDGEFGAYELYMNDGTDEGDNAEAGDGKTDMPENDPAVYLSASRAKRAKEVEKLRGEGTLAPGAEVEDDDNEEEDDDDDDDDDDEEDEEEEEGDSVLLTSQARWNTFTLVYRDPGVLKFVKYVSKLAPGSRWDIAGEWKPGSSPEEE